jgi:hypothetical protein
MAISRRSSPPDRSVTTPPLFERPAAEPRPADRHPVAVYLARLALSSRRPMRAALEAAARLLTHGQRAAEGSGARTARGIRSGGAHALEAVPPKGWWIARVCARTSRVARPSSWPLRRLGRAASPWSVGCAVAPGPTPEPTCPRRFTPR